MSGWIKFYRSLIDHDLVGFKKPFTKAEAWIWMLAEAKYEDTKEYRDFGGKERLINMPRGTLTHSLRFMSKAFGWSTSKLKTFLNHLENSKNITQKPIQQITQITICNYDVYQGNESQQPIQQRNSNVTATKQQRNKHKNVKKEKKKRRYREYVLLKPVEYEKLVKDHGKDFVEACLDRLNIYKGSTGRTYRSDYMAMYSWVIDAEVEKGGWRETK